MRDFQLLNTNIDKLLFALKSVKRNPGSPMKGMERNTLEIASRTEMPASDNMITVLFAYNWMDQIHFLFPFIEMNLDHVLRHGKGPVGLSSRLGPDEQLPEHWLWRELKGVCCAMSVFQKRMRNPFPDVNDITIALDFDLTPANILVTADGKLKITDFGQSMIRILGEGKDMMKPYDPVNYRYSAPELLPVLHCDAPDDVEVFPNYDVWSLGCIMVEVLIHMLDLQTLEAFDQGLGEEEQAGFSTGTDLKQCVNSSLEEIRHVSRDSAERCYMATITDLIRAMLRHDVKSRPYSWEVFDELREAETVLMDLPIPRDQIHPAITQYVLENEIGFQELGWDDGHSIVSFADK